MEYVEREDEFDIHPAEEIHKRIMHQEDEDIDVLTVEPIRGGMDEGDFRMPVLLGIEDSDSEEEFVAIGAGQFRRKSPGKEWMVEEDDNSSIPGSDDQLTPRKGGSLKARRR